MQRPSLFRLSAAAILLAAFAASSQAAVFTTSNLADAGSWNTVYAQGFSPSVQPTPDLGLGAGDAVFLTTFEFYKSGNADAASNFQLAIVDEMFHDYATSPLTTSSAALIGLSANTIASTAPLTTGAPITFAFANLALTYGEDYAAVFVTDDGNGNLTPVLVSSLTENYVETSPGSGVFVPASNYGTDAQFDYATSNFINAGFFSTFSEAGDAAFSATLLTVPEPASAMLCLGGLALLAARRRAH